MENAHGQIPKHPLERIHHILSICLSRDPKIICSKIKSSTGKVISSSSREVGERTRENRVYSLIYSLRPDKLIGTTAITKHYCQYRKDISLLRMINFTQTSSKQVQVTRAETTERIDRLGVRLAHALRYLRPSLSCSSCRRETRQAVHVRSARH